MVVELAMGSIDLPRGANLIGEQRGPMGPEGTKTRTYRLLDKTEMRVEEAYLEAETCAEQLAGERDGVAAAAAEPGERDRVRIDVNEIRSIDGKPTLAVEGAILGADEKTWDGMAITVVCGAETIVVLRAFFPRPIDDPARDLMTTIARSLRHPANPPP